MNSRTLAIIAEARTTLRSSAQPNAGTTLKENSLPNLVSTGKDNSKMSAIPKPMAHQRTHLPTATRKTPSKTATRRPTTTTTARPTGLGMRSSQQHQRPMTASSKKGNSLPNSTMKHSARPVSSQNRVGGSGRKTPTVSRVRRKEDDDVDSRLKKRIVSKQLNADDAIDVDSVLGHSGTDKQVARLLTRQTNRRNAPGPRPPIRSRVAPTRSTRGGMSLGSTGRSNAASTLSRGTSKARVGRIPAPGAKSGKRTSLSSGNRTVGSTSFQTARPRRLKHSDPRIARLTRPAKKAAPVPAASGIRTRRPASTPGKQDKPAQQQPLKQPEQQAPALDLDLLSGFSLPFANGECKLNFVSTEKTAMIFKGGLPTPRKSTPAASTTSSRLLPESRQRHEERPDEQLPSLKHRSADANDSLLSLDEADFEIVVPGGIFSEPGPNNTAATSSLFGDSFASRQSNDDVRRRLEWGQDDEDDH